jgi:cysteine-rich repeat protein
MKYFSSFLKLWRQHTVLAIFITSIAAAAAAAGFATVQTSVMASVRPQVTLTRGSSKKIPRTINRKQSRSSSSLHAASSNKRSARFLRGESGSTVATSRTKGSDVTKTIEYEKARCGDSMIVGDEECDDGNASAGDGCSSSCEVEDGYVCGTRQPSICVSMCGDGLISSNEECDDFGRIDGDGCNAYCHVEPGWSCSGTPSSCTEND